MSVMRLNQGEGLGDRMRRSTVVLFNKMNVYFYVDLKWSRDVQYLGVQKNIIQDPILNENTFSHANSSSRISTTNHQA